MQSPLEKPALAKLWEHSRVLICVGSGGVGKTTMAAALAIQAAICGRKVLVLTIDPARRLADALGISALHHQIQTVPTSLLSEVANAQKLQLPEGASLSAMMVEQKEALDDIVKRYAKDAAHASRLLQNRIYQQISTSLPGAHEYASMSVLYDCEKSSMYDLIVLDTPPTTNALDFLESPLRMNHAIDSKALDWLVRAYGSGSSGIRMLGIGGTLMIRALAKLAGSSFLEETAQFVTEFAPILQGLKQRASEITSLLKRTQTDFVIVSSPESLSVGEASSLSKVLFTKNFSLSGWIVNRYHPKRPPIPNKENLKIERDQLSTIPSLSKETQEQLFDNLLLSYQEEQILAERDQKMIEQIRTFSSVPVKTIPLFQSDIHGSEGLSKITQSLLHKEDSHER